MQNDPHSLFQELRPETRNGMFQKLAATRTSTVQKAASGGDEDNHNCDSIHRGNDISIGGLQRKCEYQIDKIMRTGGATLQVPDAGADDQWQMISGGSNFALQKGGERVKARKRERSCERASEREGGMEGGRGREGDERRRQLVLG